MNPTRTKGILVLLISTLAIFNVRSQNVAINAGGASPNASAILDLDGVTGFTGPNGYKGLLIPRMTQAQRTGIATLPAAAQGLFVYQTDGVQGFYYNSSVTTTPNWVYLISSLGADWNTLGNTGTTQPASPATYGTSIFGAAENWMGTTDAKDVVFGANNIERMRLFSSGQLTIGSAAVGAKLSVHQTTGTAVARFTTYANTNDIELRRAQGSQTTPTATAGASTVLGRLLAQGYDGGSFTTAASISMETDAAGGTSTDMPGRIVFNTTPDGTGAVVERMRIDNAGNVGIGMTPVVTSHISGTSSSAYSGGFISQAISYTGTSTNATSNNNTHIGASIQGRAATNSRVKNLYGIEGDAIMGKSIATGLATAQVVGVFGTASGLSGIAATSVGEIYGVMGQAQIFDPLSSTSIAGVASNLFFFSGAPTYTNASLFKGVCNASDISSGTITTLYGLNIPVLTKTAPAVVNTAYGSWVDMPTAGTANYCAYFGGTVGIGATTPAAALDVYSKFQVDVNGNLIKINNVTYTWPGSNAAGVLTNNGSGTLTWTAASGSGWGLTGNAGTDGGTTNFIGTTDAKALSFHVGGSTAAFRAGLIDPVATSGTFFGYQSGKGVAAGATNINSTGFGYLALTAIASFGTHNAAFGKMALTANTDGFSNTAIGSLAMQANVHGGQNTAVGVNSLGATVGDGSGLGEGNTAVGFQTLLNNTTGSYNTAIGWYAYNLFGNRNNCMTLGADQFNFCQPTGNNQVWVGDNQITSIKGQVAFTTYSDGRVKNDVQENVPGLAFINELRPVTYNYDMEKELEIVGGKKPPLKADKYDIEKIKFSGFIAQEVETAAIKIGYDFSGVDKPIEGKGLYGLRYSEFVVPLVKAVQELSTENESLKAKVEQVSEDNKAIKAELEKIKTLLETNQTLTSTK